MKTNRMNYKMSLLGLVLLATACGPKNDEVKDEQVTVAPVPEALDSIADTEKDAVQTDENEINPTMPMPQPVMQLLTEQYAGWQQPTLTAEAQQYAEGHLQGPMIVRGDFDGDTRQDLALQLQQGDNVVVVAALQVQDYEYNLHELTRDILFNERGQLKSLYYLYLLEQGEALHSEEANEEVEAPNDAVAVGIEGKGKGYVFRDGAFVAYDLGD